MRNKYEGVCYYCGTTVAKQAGHFERHINGWRTIHANCVFDNRAKKIGATHKAEGKYYAFDNGTFVLSEKGEWMQLNKPMCLKLEALR